MKRLILPLLAMLGLSACVTVPSGPSVMVLPAAGKPFDQFQADDAGCRQWAFQQSGAPVDQTGNVVASAAIGTIIGGAIGAAFGAIGGNPALGAAVGAGVGAAGGTATGANAASLSSWEMQRRYDYAYQQCMYARGNQIPGVATRRTSYGPPPPPPPPPPPGAGQYVPSVPANAALPPPDAPPPPPPLPPSR